MGDKDLRSSSGSYGFYSRFGALIRRSPPRAHTRVSLFVLPPGYESVHSVRGVLGDDTASRLNSARDPGISRLKSLSRNEP